MRQAVSGLRRSGGPSFFVTPKFAYFGKFSWRLRLNEKRNDLRMCRSYAFLHLRHLSFQGGSSQIVGGRARGRGAAWGPDGPSRILQTHRRSGASCSASGRPFDRRPILTMAGETQFCKRTERNSSWSASATAIVVYRAAQIFRSFTRQSSRTGPKKASLSRQAFHTSCHSMGHWEAD
jgi:hypothetical protein